MHGESQDWFFEAKKITAPTLWDEAEKSGLKTAMIRWPATVGAQVSWLIPEVFPVSSHRDFPVGEYMLQHSTPDLIRHLQAKSILPRQNNHESLDLFTCETALSILDTFQPNLMFLHFSLLDHAIHQFGKTSVEAKAAFSKIGSLMRKLLQGIDSSRTTVFIFGDHGFLDFQKKIHINALFKKLDWIKTQDHQILDWKVIAHTSCAQAAVYLKDESLKPQVFEVLKEFSNGLFKVWTRSDLDRFHAFPNAICSIEANPGLSLGQNLDGELLESLPSPRGEHGYFPSSPDLFTEFFACGPPLEKNKNLGKIRVIDIAPTAAELLGLSLNQAEGKSLAIFKHSRD
jgi:predicted AlkP superfamily pyrophosphatase or phosphodiesterase